MRDVAQDPMQQRDLVGYGEFPPNPRWPNQAIIAVNFNLNVEGGGEATLANGDDYSEGSLDTTTLEPGNYIVRVWAGDYFGNNSYLDTPVEVTR